MSIQNRKIKEEGAYSILNETKFQRLLGKIYCLFKGHKEVFLKNKKYCICCWKELDE